MRMKRIIENKATIVMSGFRRSRNYGKVNTWRDRLRVKITMVEIGGLCVCVREREREREREGLREREADREKDTWVRGVRKIRINNECKEKKNYKKTILFFSIGVHTIPNLEWYCSFILNVLAFKTSYVWVFLVFGVLNSKCQIFSIYHTRC